MDRRFEYEFARRLSQELNSFEIASRPFPPAMHRRLLIRSIVLAAGVALALSAVAVALAGSTDPGQIGKWVQTKIPGGDDRGGSSLVGPSPEPSPSHSAAAIKHSAVSPTPGPEGVEATPTPFDHESADRGDSEPPYSSASSARTSAPPPPDEVSGGSG